MVARMFVETYEIIIYNQMTLKEVNNMKQVALTVKQLRVVERYWEK